MQPIGSGKFLIANVYRTTRAPSIEELYNQGPHLAAYTYEKGDKDLDAESGYGGEVEFKWKWERSEYALILRGENLLDAEIENHLSRLKSVMPEKGRSFSGLLKIAF